MCACVSLGAQEASEFTIVSITPSPDSLVPVNLSEIKVVFSHDVVSEEEIGKPRQLEQAIFRITPHLPGQYQWIDARTLVMKPKVPLREATAYTIRFHDQVVDRRGRLLAGRHDFSFHTKPLEVVNVEQVDYYPNGGVVLKVDFSLPVLPQKLRGFLLLKNQEGQEIPYTLNLGPANSTLFLTTAPLENPVLFVEILAGLTSERGPLGLESTYQKKIEVRYAFEITGSYTYPVSMTQTALFFSTSSPPEPRTLSSFVQVDPPTSFTVRALSYGFEVVGNFLPRSRVVVTLKKGLTSLTGAKLQEDFTKAFLIPDLYPSLLFPTSGIYLSSTHGTRLPMEMVNVERVKLTVWRVYENNLPLAFLEDPYYEIPPEMLSELVYEATLFNDSEPNTPTRKAIDLQTLCGGKKGVYLIIAEDELQGWVRAKQAVVFTDIAPTVKLSPGGMLVWVNSLGTGQALAGAKVTILSRANQILAEGYCDEKGVFSLEREEPWPQGNLSPYLAVVSFQNDTSFLLLHEELFSLGGFDTTGREYLRKGYEAFLYLPRGVFRPGEMVDAKAIVRAPQVSVPPPFPLAFSVITSMGRTLFEKTILLSEEGTAHLSFALPEGAPTGTYLLRCAIPGEREEFLAEKSFLVEDFVPPRMRLNLSCDREALALGEVVAISLGGEYVFGAKAAQIPYSGEVSIESRLFQHPNWQGFIFANEEREFAPLRFPLGEGILDENGEGTVTFTLPADLLAPSFLQVQFVITLNDPAGRPVSQRLSLPLYPYPFFLGIKYTEKEREPGQPVDFQVVAVKPDGSLERSVPSVVVRVSRVIRHYVMSEIEGKARYSIEEEFVREREDHLPLKEGMGHYLFTPSDYGEYLVEVSHPESGSSSAVRVRVYGKYGFLPQGETLFDRITMNADRTSYLPGDEATITYQAPFLGKALVTVETDRVVWQELLELSSERGTLRIPITEAMSPNAYCSMILIRAATENSPLPQRALGTIPLFLDRSHTRLHLSIEAPPDARPGSELPIRVTVRDARGNPVPQAEISLALVDVGLLDLTAEKTPDPWGFFNAKRKLMVGTFDPYGQLLTPEVATTPLLHPAGGEAAEMLAQEFAPLRPRVFTIVSFFEPRLVTDSQGVAETQFTLSDFDGRLRLTVVGVRGENFATAEEEILVRGKVVTEVVAPRAVAPSDLFEVVFTLFSQSEQTENVTVNLATNGLLSLEGPPELHVEIPKGGKSTHRFFVRAQELLGEGMITITTHSLEGERVDRVSVMVRPITPRVTFSGGGSISPSERMQINIPGEWLPHSVQGYLLFSTSPRIDLTRLATFLFEYPYGCLEQTVSSAWVLLLLPDLLRDVDPLLAQEEEVQKAMRRRIVRILSMQTYEGGFAAWPGDSFVRYWDAVYATHFLYCAEEAGWGIPPSTLYAARDFLLSLLTLEPYSSEEATLRSLYSTQAYAAYVLASSGETPLAWMEHLREQTEFLSDSGTLFLALAYLHAGQKDVALELAGGYLPSLEEAPQTGDIYESPLRKMALSLLFHVRFDPTSGEATVLANKLRDLLHRTKDLSTQESAFVVMALNEYFATQKSAPYLTFTIYDLGGKELYHFVNQEKVILPLEKIPFSLQVENQVSGKIFYLLSASGVPLTPPKPWAQGMSVERIYLDANDKPLESLTVTRGELVKVLLRVRSGQVLENVVIVDLIPGGLEIENPRLSTSYTSPQDLPAFQPSSLHVEMRDDRLILFVPFLDHEFEYQYTARAVTAGEFALPQIKAECMYNPAISSLQGEGKLVVKREETTWGKR